MPSKLPLETKCLLHLCGTRWSFSSVLNVTHSGAGMWMFEEGLTEHVTEADKPCRPSILGLLGLPERQWPCTSKHAIRAGESSTGEPDSLDFPWTWRHHEWTSHGIGDYQSLKGFSSTSNEDTTGGKNKTSECQWKS